MEKGCISICKKNKNKNFKKISTLKSNPQSNCPVICPTAHTHLPGLCLHGSCCIGSAPWCSANPSPSPGLQGVISEAPTHSSRQTSGVCPGSWATGQSPRRHACTHDPRQYPHGMATLPTARLPHPTSHAGWRPSGSGSNCSPTPKEVPSLPLCIPSFLPKDSLVPHSWRPALGVSSLLPSPCPPSTQFYVFQL